MAGMPPRPASIKVRALQWLAQREHSREELRGKLLRLLRRHAAIHTATSAADDVPLGPLEADPQADPAVEVDALLQWLETHGYLSESRFVESRVHARQARYGNQRIRQELKQHGVTLNAETQQALAKTEYDRALVVWRKKFGAPGEDASARVRQMRFLAGRGFSADVVRRVVQARSADDAPAFEVDSA
jgi:regulatory protein